MSSNRSLRRLMQRTHHRCTLGGQARTFFIHKIILANELARNIPRDDSPMHHARRLPMIMNRVM